VSPFGGAESKNAGERKRTARCLGWLRPPAPEHPRMSSGCEPQSPGAPPFSRWSRTAAGEVTASSVVGAASGCPVVAHWRRPTAGGAALERLAAGSETAAAQRGKTGGGEAVRNTPAAAAAWPCEAHSLRSGPAVDPPGRVRSRLAVTRPSCRQRERRCRLKKTRLQL
jgi:hypothetical protein